MRHKVRRELGFEILCRRTEWFSMHHLLRTKNLHLLTRDRIGRDGMCSLIVILGLVPALKPRKIGRGDDYFILSTWHGQFPVRISLNYFSVRTILNFIILNTGCSKSRFTKKRKETHLRNLFQCMYYKRFSKCNIYFSVTVLTRFNYGVNNGDVVLSLVYDSLWRKYATVPVTLNAVPLCRHGRKP